MLDIGWSEMAIVMLVALLVIGPKDLPRVARSIGKWAAKARSMAREFQRSLDDMAREAELDDLKSEIDKVRHGNIGQTIRDAVDPKGELDGAFELGVDRPDRRVTPAVAADDKAPARVEQASPDAESVSAAMAEAEPAAPSQTQVAATVAGPEQPSSAGAGAAADHDAARKS